MLDSGYLWLTLVAQNHFVYYVGIFFGLCYFAALLLAYSKKRTAPAVIPLSTPRESDKIIEYIVVIYTSPWPGYYCPSSTSVYLNIQGLFAETGFILLKKQKSNRQIFSRGSFDIFIINTEEILGDLKCLELELKNVSEAPSTWKPVKIEIFQFDTKERWFSHTIPCLNCVNKTLELVSLSKQEKVTERWKTVFFNLLNYHYWLFSITEPDSYGSYTTIVRTLLTFFTESSLLFGNILCYVAYHQADGAFNLSYQNTAGCFIALTVTCVAVFALEFVLRNARPTFQRHFDGIPKDLPSPNSTKKLGNMDAYANALDICSTDSGINISSSLSELLISKTKEDTEDTTIASQEDFTKNIISDSASNLQKALKHNKKVGFSDLEGLVKNENHDSIKANKSPNCSIDIEACYDGKSQVNSNWSTLAPEELRYLWNNGRPPMNTTHGQWAKIYSKPCEVWETNSSRTSGSSIDSLQSVETDSHTCCKQREPSSDHLDLNFSSSADNKSQKQCVVKCTLSCADLKNVWFNGRNSANALPGENMKIFKESNEHWETNSSRSSLNTKECASLEHIPQLDLFDINYNYSPIHKSESDISLQPAKSSDVKQVLSDDQLYNRDSFLTPSVSPSVMETLPQLEGNSSPTTGDVSSKAKDLSHCQHFITLPKNRKHRQQRYFQLDSLQHKKTTLLKYEDETFKRNITHTSNSLSELAKNLNVHANPAQDSPGRTATTKITESEEHVKYVHKPRKKSMFDVMAPPNQSNYNDDGKPTKNYSDLDEEIYSDLDEEIKSLMHKPNKNVSTSSINLCSKDSGIIDLVTSKSLKQCKSSLGSDNSPDDLDMKVDCDSMHILHPSLTEDSTEYISNDQSFIESELDLLDLYLQEELETVLIEGIENFQDKNNLFEHPENFDQIKPESKVADCKDYIFNPDVDNSKIKTDFKKEEVLDLCSQTPETLSPVVAESFLTNVTSFFDNLNIPKESISLATLIGSYTNSSYGHTENDSSAVEDPYLRRELQPEFPKSVTSESWLADDCKYLWLLLEDLSIKEDYVSRLLRTTFYDLDSFLINQQSWKLLLNKTHNWCVMLCRQLWKQVKTLTKDNDFVFKQELKFKRWIISKGLNSSEKSRKASLVESLKESVTVMPPLESTSLSSHGWSEEEKEETLTPVGVLVGSKAIETCLCLSKQCHQLREIYRYLILVASDILENTVSKQFCLIGKDEKISKQLLVELSSSLREKVDTKAEELASVIVQPGFFSSFELNWAYTEDPGHKLLSLIVVDFAARKGLAIYKYEWSLGRTAYVLTTKAIKAAVKDTSTEIIKGSVVEELCQTAIDNATEEVYLELSDPIYLFTQHAIKQKLISKTKKTAHNVQAYALLEDSVKLLTVSWCAEGLNLSVHIPTLLTEALINKFFKNLTEEESKAMTNLLQLKQVEHKVYHVVKSSLYGAVEYIFNIVSTEKNVLKQSRFKHLKEILAEEFNLHIDMCLSKVYKYLLKKCSGVFEDCLTDVIISGMVDKVLLNAQGSLMNEKHIVKEPIKAKETEDVAFFCKPAEVSDTFLELQSVQVVQSVLMDAQMTLIESSIGESFTLDDDEVNQINSDIKPLVMYTRFIDYNIKQRNMQELKKELKRYSKRHRGYVTVNLHNVTDSHFIVDANPSYIDRDMFLLEWFVTGQLQKILAPGLKLPILVLMFLFTIYCLVFVSLKGSELTIIQCQEWICLYLITSLIFAFIVTPLKVLFITFCQFFDEELFPGWNSDR